MTTGVSVVSSPVMVRLMPPRGPTVLVAAQGMALRVAPVGIQGPAGPQGEPGRIEVYLDLTYTCPTGTIAQATDPVIYELIAGNRQ